MTDQSPNDQFHASSFMQGANAAYLEQLYAQYAKDPNAVDEAWRGFFEALGDTPNDAVAEAQGPSWARADWPPHARRRADQRADRRMAGGCGGGEGGRARRSRKRRPKRASRSRTLRCSARCSIRSGR
jgi:2-oxoglutarate dehydrogenase complex dehydrogenase (E1) component-like enzyme